MSMDEFPSRCVVCGQHWPYNAPLPGPGDCSCIRCDDCGHVFDEDENWCRACGNNYGGDEPSGSSVDVSAQLASYQSVK